jgi:hypothetical protein
MSEKVVKILPEIKPHSIIAIRSGGLGYEQFSKVIDSLSAAVTKGALPPVTVMQLNDDADISVLDEDRMRELGWVRIEKVEENIK